MVPMPGMATQWQQEVIIDGEAGFDKAGTRVVELEITEGLDLMVGGFDPVPVLPEVADCQHGQGRNRHPCFMRVRIIGAFRRTDSCKAE